MLIFGESAADEAYHLPESLADVEIWCRTPNGERTALKTEKVDNDDRVGLVAPLPNAELPEVIETTREYGVYGDFLLTYYAKHIRAKSNDQLAAAGPSKELKLDVVPKATDEGLELTVLWDGKPRAGVDVNVKVDGENEDVEAEKLKTDADGKVTLQPEGCRPGRRAGQRPRRLAKRRAQGQEVHQRRPLCVAHVPLAATPRPSSRHVEEPKPEKAAENKSRQSPPLPEAVSSFGAAVADGYLYVYSGHTGTEHDHSAANLSQHFRPRPARRRHRVGRAADGNAAARPAAGGPRRQDLPRRRPERPQRHDRRRRRPALDHRILRATIRPRRSGPRSPRCRLPRSSHNAVVIGDKLYVTGGWTLSGSREGEWLDDSLVYDFSDPGAGWQKLPKQDFQRRALRGRQWQGKLAALGGMDEEANISRRVDFFDPATGKWSQGPELPGTGMSGFGVSAWSLGDDLYVSGFNGRVFKLADDGSKWEVVAKLAQPRFFHQLVPAAKDDALLVVGGASRDGHLDDVELIDVSAAAVKKAGAAADDAEQAADAGSYHHHHGHGDGAKATLMLTPTPTRANRHRPMATA